MPSAATPAVPRDFPPTVEAARARLAAVCPADDARSRNHLNGAVTRLSPYLTHGLLTLAEVVDTLRAAHRLPLTHKLMQELGWRAFFRHAWRHDGERILESLHPGPLPDAAYAHAMPEDVRAGATGVPVIDQAVRTLYASGYLHNHARMWLASYLVHIRKVHWRAGADWMVAHPGVSEPPRFPCPLEGGYGAPDPAAVAGQDVWLVHPWSLADPPAGCPQRARLARRAPERAGLGGPQVATTAGPLARARRALPIVFGVLGPGSSPFGEPPHHWRAIP